MAWTDHGGHLRWYEPTGRGNQHFGCHVTESTEDPPAPAKPTDYPPGSAGRVEVMAARARRGEAIFHKDDSRDFDQWFTKNNTVPALWCGPVPEGEKPKCRRSIARK